MNWGRPPSPRADNASLNINRNLSIPYKSPQTFRAFWVFQIELRTRILQAAESFSSSSSVPSLWCNSSEMKRATGKMTAFCKKHLRIKMHTQLFCHSIVILLESLLFICVALELKGPPLQLEVRARRAPWFLVYNMGNLNHGCCVLTMKKVQRRLADSYHWIVFQAVSFGLPAAEFGRGKNKTGAQQIFLYSGDFKALSKFAWKVLL